MYTTIIHPLRKAYCLSINEYCVLEAIRTLSQNNKHGGWCIAKNEYIADGLDLSSATVKRAKQKLLQIELIEKFKDNSTDTRVRTTDEWNNLFLPQNEEMLLAIKTGKHSLVTLGSKRSKQEDHLDQNDPNMDQIEPSTRIKLSHNTKTIYTKSNTNNISSNEENPDKKENLEEETINKLSVDKNLEELSESVEKKKLPENPKDWSDEMIQANSIGWLFRVYIYLYRERYEEMPALGKEDFAQFGANLKRLLQGCVVDGIEFPTVRPKDLQKMFVIYFRSDDDFFQKAKHSFKLLIAGETLRKLKIELTKQLTKI